MARNHTDKGVRVSWKIVPAVTEVWYPHPAHSLRLRTGHAFPDPQWAQRKPVGQRSRAKYARHASSVLKFASNSVRLRGYSSTISAHYILGLPESSGYPPGPIPDYGDADRWLRLAATRGDADAQFWLGAGYEQGRFGVIDYREALKW